MVWEDCIIGAACVHGCIVVFAEHGSYRVGRGGVGGAVLVGEALGEASWSLGLRKEV